MTPERWQQIDQLFHSALECPSSDRAAFLTQACAGDESLRREVESLVESHEQSDSFIDKPADDIAAELLTGAQTWLSPGQRIGHYSIGVLLGAGGMGEVYLAQDLKLGRQIALKLLPAEFTRNQDRLRRLEREARAASALNHPNIVTIHEVGQSNSYHFIATEFIDGETLRLHMTRCQSQTTSDPSAAAFRIGQVLEITTQIASALAAAHEVGIVHRDIKPENIMLRRDGFVKVLDFGLAKLALPQVGTANIGAATGLMVTTNPGVVMGTVRYMSPEQARGLDVDARTDIWSLGVVLYEMLTGRAPFEGETPSHVIISILEKEPLPLVHYSEVPQELQRIVTKVLRKNKEERYRTAGELANDLKNLTQELAVEAHLKRSFQGHTTRTETTTFSGGQAVSGILPPSESRTLRVDAAYPTFSAEYVTSKIKVLKLIPALILTILLFLGVSLGLYIFVLRDRLSTKPAAPFQAIEFNRLTNTGRVKDAVISLDGKYVAYVADDGGRESIRLRQVATSNNVEIVPPAEIQYYGTTFSHDGNHLYYIVKERNNTIGVLHRVSVLGGVSTRVIADVDGPISLSPDDKQFAFVRGSSSGERALLLANADGGAERKLAVRTGYDAFSFGGPAWSPDGKSIASGASDTDSTGRYMSIVAVDVGDGSIRPLTTQKWRGIGRIWWLQDGKGLVFSATDLGRKTTSQLWYLSYPDGEARRITRDLQDYHGVSLTSDSTALVSKQTQTISSLWIAPNDDVDRAKQILSHKEDDGYNAYHYTRTRFSWMPDGQIIYTSLINGNPSIWIMTPQGTKNKQLTSDSSGNSFPSVTSDGRYVVFVSDRTGFTNVWRIDIDGNNEKQLTTGEDDPWAWCSPDGQWVVYHSGVLGKRTLRRVSINGGESEQLTDYPSVCPVVSPDGKWISCYYRPETKAPWKLAVISFNGGPPVKTFDVPQNVVFQTLVRWTPDSGALAYITSRDGVSNIWIQPLDGTAPKQLTNFKSDQIFWFDWSPDRRQLGVSRGAVTSDVVLIKDLR